MKRQLLASIVGLALAGLFVPQAHAGAFAVTFTQAGSNVVAVASGSINLAGLSLFQSATSGYGDCASVEASAGSFDVGGSGPCDYTTPGLANACPSGEELDTFSSGIITFGTSTGPATSSLCANFTPADLYTGSINGPQTFGPGATGGSLTCVDSPTTISGSSLGIGFFGLHHRKLFFYRQHFRLLLPSLLPQFCLHRPQQRARGSGGLSVWRPSVR